LTASPGAQAASHRVLSLATVAVMAVMAVLIALTGIFVSPSSTEASSRHKVVIVVGPVGRHTNPWKREARHLARQARRYGARVREVYSPRATWARVRRASKGADLFVYFGHGNGWPSPYGPFQTRTKNGLGLNARPGRGNHNVRDVGERYLRGLRLRAGAVVLLAHLCYSAGNSQPGMARPSLRTARLRVDHYAAGFLRAGADAVFAETRGRASYLLRGLFRSRKTLRQIFWSSPTATPRYQVRFNPRRSPRWASALMDPRKRGDYRRSVVGRLDTRASVWRQG
jgi:hypothetical protein